MSKAGFESISVDNSYHTNELNLLDAGIEGVSFNSHPLSEILNVGYGHFKKHKQSILLGEHKELIIVDVMDEYVDDGKCLTFKKYYSKSFFDSFKFFKSFTQIDLLSTSPSKMCKGPYLVISNLKDISLNANKKFIAPSFVAVIPVASKSQWCLIKNDYERQMIAQLLKSLEWYQKRQYACTVTKPFESINTPLGHCHPDFIIGSVPNRQIIEVMGGEERAYEGQKLTSHIIMSSIGKVYVYDPFKANGKDLKKHCFDISTKAITMAKSKNKQ